MRGYSLSDICELLPKSKDNPIEDGLGDEPLPEALMWLFLTSDFPNAK